MNWKLLLKNFRIQRKSNVILVPNSANLQVSPVACILYLLSKMCWMFTMCRACRNGYWKNRYFSVPCLCSFLMIPGKHPPLVWKELKATKEHVLLSVAICVPLVVGEQCVHSPTGLLPAQSKGSEMVSGKEVLFPKMHMLWLVTHLAQWILSP